MNLLDEIADYRAREIAQGRTPRSVWLTKDEAERLKDWEKRNLAMTKREEPNDSKTYIFGMEVITPA